MWLSIVLTSELAFVQLSLELNFLKEFSDLSIAHGSSGGGGIIYSLVGRIDDCLLQLVKLHLMLIVHRDFLNLLTLLVVYHRRIFRTDVSALGLIHTLDFYAWSITAGEV